LERGFGQIRTRKLRNSARRRQAVNRLGSIKAARFYCVPQRNFWEQSGVYFKAKSFCASAYTLVEIMIVVAVIALLAAITIPGFLRARDRAIAVRIRNDLRLIDSAVEQYAIETGKKSGDPVAVSDWTNYIKKNTALYLSGEDLLGNEYGPQT